MNDIPALHWTFTGRRKLGWWPCLIFKTYDGAITSGLTLPNDPDSKRDMMNIEKKMKNLKTKRECEKCMVYLLEVHIWTCLSLNTNRIGEIYMYDSARKTKEILKRQVGPSANELVVFRKALLYADRISQKGFQSWLNDDKIINRILFDSTLFSDLTLSAEIFERNDPMLIFEQEKKWSKDDIMWVPSFLDLYKFMKIHPFDKCYPVETNFKGAASGKNSPTSTLDTQSMQSIIKQGLDLSRGHHSAILCGFTALHITHFDCLEPFVAPSHQFMVQSAIKRGKSSIYHNIHYENINYAISNDAKMYLDEAMIHIKAFRFEEGSRCLEQM